MNKSVLSLACALIAGTWTSSAAASADAEQYRDHRAFSVKVGASKLKTDISGDADFQLNGRSLSLDYTSESNRWTSNSDLYLGYVAGLDVHYNSKKKSDTQALYQIEEVSSAVYSLAPKISYMINQQTALYGFAGLSYARLEAKDFIKTDQNKKVFGEVFSGFGYLWGVGARYELRNGFEFSGEVRGSHNNIENSSASGKSDLYGLYVGMGYRF